MLTAEQIADRHQKALAASYRRGINGLLDKLAMRFRYASDEQRARIIAMLEAEEGGDS